MKDQAKTKEQLITELEHLRQRFTQAEQAAYQQSETLYEVMLALTSRTSLTTVLDEILRQAHRIVSYHTASIMLLEVDTLRIARWKGYDIYGGEQMVSTLEQPLAEFPMDNKAIQSGEPVVIFDTHQDPHWVVLEETTWIRSTLILPLRLYDHVPGVLRLDGSKPGEFSIEDANRLKPLAGAAAIALENAQLFEAQQAARRLAETLRTANLSLTQTLDLHTILETLLDYLNELVIYDTASVILLEDKTLGTFKAVRGYPKDKLSHFLNLCLDIKNNAILKDIATQQTSIVISNTETHPQWDGAYFPEDTCSWLGGALIAGGNVIGIYTLAKTQVNFFDEEHIRLSEVLAAQAAIAIENARLFEQVHAGRERLKVLSRQLVEVQEAERRYIARELHDEIGQALTGLKLLLEMVVRAPLDADEARRRLGQAQELVDRLMNQVHNLSLDLRPPMLDDLGLLPALLWYFNLYTERTGVQVILKHRMVKNRRFPPEIETAAYRIIQEALTNVARHAGVDQITARVFASDQRLRVQIEDRGNGFNAVKTIAFNDRRGINGMRERANLLGGQLDIVSNVGVGTRVTAELPLP